MGKPHEWIYLDVEGTDWKVVNWGVESGAPNALLRRGYGIGFPYWTQIVVEGYQAKNGTPTANGVTVKFSDGSNFFVGSSGTGAPDPASRR